MTFAVLACLSALISLCLGHGRLIEPPSRASAWRFGFNTPKDYNDNEGFCGGFSHQYQTQGGKCGICGDAWDQSPRAHEVGGLYATGVIVRHYHEGQVVNVTIDITANHLGHFEVRICPDPEIDATQECLDMHRIGLADESGVDFTITADVGLHTMLIQLPQGLTCQHCVLQWRYQTGNNWGQCSDGSQALGCGLQEEFRACADVSISPKVQVLRHQQNIITTQKLGDLPSESGIISPSNINMESKRLISCKGTGIWASLPQASKWCTMNCSFYPEFCPESLCSCV